MFIDTHCHIYDEYYENIDSIVDKIKSAGIVKVINNGCDDKSNREVLEKLKKYDFMYGALGIHPENIDDYQESDLQFVFDYARDNKVVAIGEIGLDYHYENESREKQIELFDKQLTFAEENDIPVIIHSRDALEDTINVLKKHKCRGVIHSFSGSYETACIYIKMGFVLGINGVVTFKNCKLKDVIERIDLRNIVLETDSPYLTPVPFRGERNDSSHIVDIAKFIADCKGISIGKVAEETCGNVKRVFDI